MNPSLIFGYFLFQALFTGAVQALLDKEDLVILDFDVHRVDNLVSERFLSVTIDASLVAEEKFMHLLGSPKLRALANALSPAFLRFGGTTQDFMKFSPQSEYLLSWNNSRNSLRYQGHSCDTSELPPLLEDKLKQEWALQAQLLHQQELQDKYKKVKFSEDAVDLLYSFANCSGLDLIFGLNALLRTPGNTWDSQNAEMLMNYCESRRYIISWELGNGGHSRIREQNSFPGFYSSLLDFLISAGQVKLVESTQSRKPEQNCEPNSYEKKAGIRVDGHQLGQDFLHLRSILQESKLYHSAGLYGPDVGQLREHRKDILTEFLETAADAIDATTWHHYYVNGRDATLKDFLDPQVLDTLAVKTNEVLEVVRSVSPEKKVWLGETSSAYGGGAAGLSDTFVAGFMWLDKLGLAAQLGLNVVMRQVLIGSGSYHLVDNNLDPLPDYWLSVLYKRLVGPEVLKIEVLWTSVPQQLLRVYLHCTNRNSSSYRQGAVTLFALNLSKRPIGIGLPACISNSSAEAFVLQSAEPGEEGLYSRVVELNGAPLKMLDERTLPPLSGAHVPPGEHLQMPGLSLAFYVLQQARAAVC